MIPPRPAILAAVVLCLAAAVPQASLAGLTAFTARDGLASNRVTLITEDRSGNLWFATYGMGVTRYDGNWRTFTTADGVANDTINNMLGDRSGNVWLATRLGVSRYDGATWRTFTTADGLLNDNVNSMLEDRRGNVWFSCAGGITRFDPSTSSWTSIRTTTGRLFEDSRGGLWCLAGYVYRFDPQTSTFQRFAPAAGFGDRGASYMAEDHDGRLWFGVPSSSGDYGDYEILRFDPASLEWLNLGVLDLVTSMQSDRAGVVWIAAIGPDGRAALYNHDGPTWQRFDTGATLTLSCMFPDGEGNLWLGTVYGGALRWDRSSWETFRWDVSSYNYSSVYSVCADSVGNVWTGTAQGLWRYDGASWSWQSAFDTSGWVSSSVPQERAAPPRAARPPRAGNEAADARSGVGIGEPSVLEGGSSGSLQAGGSMFVPQVSVDRAGNLWVANGSSAGRFDGTSWRWFTEDDGLAWGPSCILEDRAGNIWFGAYTQGGNCCGGGGLTRYDPHTSTWRVFTKADGLPSNFANSLAEDRDGNVWVSSRDGYYVYGAMRFDPRTSTWRRFTPADGLPSYQIEHMFRDRSGDLWFATTKGACRYDGSTWKTYTTADGLADNWVNFIDQDRAGNMWFATNAGVTRYDGSNWRSFTNADGLAHDFVSCIAEDRAGNLWFGSYLGVREAGLARYMPDRVPPHTAFLARPPKLTASRAPAATFATLGESHAVDYSYRLDDDAWSEWSPIPNWTGADLEDGIHTLEVRARDYLVNVDPSPALATIEVDATPPTPVIASPAFGQPVRGTVEIRGAAADSRFEEYRVEFRAASAAPWSETGGTLLVGSTTPVASGALATWDTSALPDGDYEVRLTLADTLGLEGTDLLSVIVDNHAPFADVTAPTTVAAGGGDVYTTNGELHLYFPPHAFENDAVVTVVGNGPASVPASLPTGATRVSAGYSLSWSGQPLVKPARLEFATAGASAAGLALYHSTDGTNWKHLGGTVNAGAQRIELAVTDPGRYALFTGGSVPDGDGLTSLSFTPRVFSPTGGFASSELAIGFTLGREAGVTVRVYNRAGRLVREVVSSQSYGPGANLVRWNGRDREGELVPDGPYVVTVEALGSTLRAPLAVVK